MPGTAGTFDTMQDRNQVYTIAGISGTLGPTYGTAEPRPLTVGENGYLNVNAAAANSTGGTLDLLKAGTITRLEGGSIAVTAGTVVVTSGTQQTLGTVGTLQAGTITRLEGGTIGSISGVGVVTSITGIASGTINNSGTVTGVGVVTSVTNLAAGTITRLEGGTVGSVNGVGVVTSITNLAAGTVTRLEGGSVNITAGTVGGKAASGAAAVQNPVLTAGTDAGGTIYAPLMTTTGHQLIDILTGTIQSSGTTTGVGVVTTVTSVTEVANLAKGTVTRLEQGSINVTAGTITAGSIVVTVGTIAAGTVAVSAGTITAGTINAGTVRINPNPTTQTMPFGTTTTGTIGTLVAAPSAGSAILIDSLDVSLHNGTADVVVSYGLVTTGNGVVTRGNFVAGGGISKNPTYPIGGSITGSALTYNILGGSGTVSYSLAYRIAVP